MNDLSDRVSIQVDGRLRSGRDVVIAAILGAREFAFGTAVLIAMGCIACGGCAEGRCPVGIATQDEDLRAKFAGKPEYLSRFFRYIAEDVRRILSSMGVKSLDELAGRYDALDYHGRDRSPRDAALDFSKITEALEIAQRPPAAWSEYGEDAAPIALPPAGLPAFLSTWRARFKMPELEADLAEPLARALARGEPFRAELTLRNSDRSIGAALSGELVRSGLDGAPKQATLLFRGSAGQSFGAFLVPSLSFILEGEANDFVGKGLSGGSIALRPAAGSSFAPEDNVIAGNVCLIGATGGELFVSGRAGERFAIRNSGAVAVVEGVGDHACEYMTGGVVVLLGRSGSNMGAGMSGGTIFALDEDASLLARIATASTRIAPLEDDERSLLFTLVARHKDRTSSPRAAALLADWGRYERLFYAVKASGAC
jgi:glutamate synthase domain-containing protein 3